MIVAKFKQAVRSLQLRIYYKIASLVGYNHFCNFFSTKIRPLRGLEKKILHERLYRQKPPAIIRRFITDYLKRKRRIFL